MSEGDLFDILPDREEEAPERHRAAEPPVAASPAEEPAAPPSAETVTTEEPEENIPQPVPAAAEEDAVTPPPPPRRGTKLPRAGTLGQTLAALRRRSGMDLETVAEETKIKSGYLKAMEDDAFADLPHMVYALAYVKKLCAVYGVSAADADELMSGLREQLAYEIPEDIDKSVICREQDEETRRKLHQISVALVAGAALLVLLVFFGVAALFLHARNRSGGGEQHGIEEQLNEDWLARHKKPQKLRSTQIKLAPYKNSRGRSRR